MIKKIILTGFAVLFLNIALADDAYDAAIILKAKGITNLSADKTNFDASLTRREAGLLLKRFGKIFYSDSLGSNTNCSFLDIGSLHIDIQNEIKESCYVGLFKGSNYKFMPLSNFTKGQIIIVLGRLLSANTTMELDAAYDKLLQEGIISVDDRATSSRYGTRRELYAMLKKIIDKKLGTTNSVSISTPTNSDCTVFPSDNPWNKDISNYPVNANSANYIASINKLRKYLHPDFGANWDGGPFGIPFVKVNSATPLVPVKAVWYPDESDQGNFPVPLNAPIEKGGDKHVIAVDMKKCKLYELYAAERVGNGREAGSVAVFDMKTNTLRPDGWTSADAAGLPIYPGLVKYEEVAAGEIKHAVRFTVSKSQKAYIKPATHYASSNTDSNLPPMGLRLRLKASYDISHLNGQAKIIATALKKYGMIVADNGSDRFISGAPDSRWDDEDLGQLKSIPGSAFEAVETGPLVKN